MTSHLCFLIHLRARLTGGFFTPSGIIGGVSIFNAEISGSFSLSFQAGQRCNFLFLIPSSTNNFGGIELFSNRHGASIYCPTCL